MNLILTRYHRDSDETLGLLHYGRDLVSYTLERQKFMIPSGRYELVLQENITPLTEEYRDRFPWFENHIMISGVPGRSNIYIHVGNEGRDSLGCVLAADQPSALSNDNRIINSVKRFELLYRLVFPKLKKHERMWIIVRNEKEVFKE